MSSATPAPVAGAPTARPWAQLGAAMPALLLGLMVIFALFWREMVAAVEVWDASTAYNHCFLVLPIAAWMAWERRALVAYVPLEPDLRACLLAIPLAGAWFVADRVGIMEGRQLAVIGLVEVLFLAVLGWNLFRLLAAPLLYLIFLVPFGAFLTPWLQDVTLWFTLKGLDLLGILYYSDGLVIEIKAGTFVIAEACAGLRFLIASIAFGTLYACTIYRSPWRRVAFVLASVIVPIIANGFRALGIVVAGYLLGSAQAAAADHVIYGWVFFSFVTLLLILIGLPFREDRDVRTELPEAPADSPPPPRQGSLRVAMALAVLIALGPGSSAALDRAHTAPPTPAFSLGPDCQPAPDIPRQRRIAAAVREFSCANGQVHITVAVFPPNANPSRIVAAQRVLSGEDGSDENDVTTVASDRQGEPRWRVVETTSPAGLHALALWLDGRPGNFGLSARIVQARASLLGGRSAPVLVAVTPTQDLSGLLPGVRAQLRQAFADYLRQQQDLAVRIGEISGATAH